MFGKVKSKEEPEKAVQQPEENEGVRILFDFKLTGETVSKIAISVISAAVVGLITTVIVQPSRSPAPMSVENTQTPKK